MKSIFTFLTGLAAWAVVLSCNGQGGKNENALDAFISKKADSLYKSQKLPGIFIGILNNGKIQYYNFGFADPDKKMPFDSTTLFEIGSITKTFTAFIVENILAEKGISDSSSILEYLPDSVKMNEALEKISFLNLLNHTSGLPRLPDNLDLSTRQPYENYDLNKLFAFLKTCKPKPPGTYEYSNLGFGLAGVLSSLINKKSYAALLDEYVFFPLKMLKPGDSIEALDKKSKGFMDNEAVDYWKFDALAGAGALKCNSAEMLTWFQFVSQPGSISRNKLIDKLLEPTVTLSAATKVCRAWHTLEEKGKPVIYWHNGGTYGFSTFGAFIKGENKAVIVVVNQFNKNAVSDGLGMEIMKRLNQ